MLKTIIYTALLFWLIPALCISASIRNKNFGVAVCADVTSIYDGDTFRCNIDGYPGIIGERIGIRVNGIDTPEMRGKCPKEKKLARQAKQAAVEMIRNGKTIELHNMKRGKYFRVVADVYVDGSSLGRMLTDRNLAVEYGGGKKVKDWCE